MRVLLTSGKSVSVTAEERQRDCPWQPSGYGYLVKCRTEGGSWQFQFWDSYHNMVTGKALDLRDAVAAWAGDALTYWQFETLDEMAREFGFADRKEAARVWRGCHKSFKQANRVGLDIDDLEELSNER